MKRLFVLWLLLFVSGFSFVKAQQPVSGNATQILRQRGEIYFRFTDHNKSRILKAGSFISIDKIRHDTVFAYANVQGFSRFLKAGIPYTVLTPPSQRLSREKLQAGHFKGTETWDSYPSYDQYVSMMQDFQRNHPGLCRVISIGKSVEGRALLFAHIGHPDSTADTLPRFMYTSTMHGDETTGYVLMLRLIDYLLNNYGKETAVTHLIDSVDIWINPLANPDGTYAGGNASVYGATRFNANHVDLNRNYPDPRAGAHPDGNAWQPETMAFMHFADSLHFVLSCNLHTGSEVANYPWDTWSVRSADDAWWQEVCRQYADTVHAHAPEGYFTGLNNGITNGYDWYSITGGRQDYMNYFQFDREFTLELSDIKIPDPVTLPQFWEYNYRSLLNYIHQTLKGLRGRVTDSITGKPLKAEIYAVNHDMNHSQVYSDSLTGIYFRPMYSGVYDFRFSSAGYRAKTIQNVQVANGRPTVLNVLLAPENTSGIEQNISAVRVYPNPASDKLYCTGIPENSMAYVINLSGIMVLSQKLYRDEYLNISKLPRGVYFLKIVSDKNTVLRKFVRR